MSSLKRKDAKDKGKQHKPKGDRGKRAHKRNQKLNRKTVDLWSKMRGGSVEQPKVLGKRKPENVH